jgi:hypothetical protein
LKLLNNEQNDEECDTRDDAMKNFSWLKPLLYFLKNKLPDSLKGESEIPF